MATGNVPNLGGDTILRLAALLAALGAITAEDLLALQKAQTLGADEAANITMLQAFAQSIDTDTIKLLNDARIAAGLPAL